MLKFEFSLLDISILDLGLIDTLCWNLRLFFQLLGRNLGVLGSFGHLRFHLCICNFLLHQTFLQLSLLLQGALIRRGLRDNNLRGNWSGRRSRGRNRGGRRLCSIRSLSLGLHSCELSLCLNRSSVILNRFGGLGRLHRLCWLHCLCRFSLLCPFDNLRLGIYLGLLVTFPLPKHSLNLCLKSFQ